MPSLLTVHDLACTRGDMPVFSGLSCGLPPGSVSVVSGPNGCGKSSLLRILAGLLRERAGRIGLNGRALDFTERRRVCAYIARPALKREMSVEDNLRFHAALQGRQAFAPEAPLRALGIESCTDTPVRALSSGLLKRAALARLYGSARKIWLLDEPEENLDEDGLMQIYSLIAAHKAEGGTAVIATHRPGLWQPDIRIDLGRYEK